MRWIRQDSVCDRRKPSFFKKEWCESVVKYTLLHEFCLLLKIRTFTCLRTAHFRAIRSYAVEGRHGTVRLEKRVAGGGPCQRAADAGPRRGEARGHRRPLRLALSAPLSIGESRVPGTRGCAAPGGHPHCAGARGPRGGHPHCAGARPQGRPSAAAPLRGCAAPGEAIRRLLQSLRSRSVVLLSLLCAPAASARSRRTHGIRGPGFQNPGLVSAPAGSLGSAPALCCAFVRSALRRSAQHASGRTLQHQRPCAAARQLASRPISVALARIGLLG